MARRTKSTIMVAVAAVVIAGLFTACQSSGPAHANQSAAAGDKPLAPQFSLTDIFGQKLNLSDYRGKVVLLDFWATWCGPCRMEIPGFIKLQRQYGSQGFQIIGISMDDSASPVLKFYKQFGMDYPVAMGNSQLAALYGGIIGLPTTFLIGRDGRIYDKVPGAVDEQRFVIEIKNLLASSAKGPDQGFKAAGDSAPIHVETPAEANSQVPGVDLTKLSSASVASYKKIIAAEPCNCGCKRNVLECRMTDPSCSESLDLAKAALAKYEKANPKI